MIIIKVVLILVKNVFFCLECGYKRKSVPGSPKTYCWLDELKEWKTTELKTFSSYIGPIILKGIVT